MKKLLIILTVLGFTCAAQADLFSVEKMAVSAEGENAVEARELALNLAVEEAYPMLIRKVVLGDSANTQASRDEISSMVQGLSIANERTTATKYTADVTVQFKQQAVKDFLKSRGVAFLDKTPPRFVIIPVYQEGESIKIFDVDSPLFTALKTTPLDTSVYQFTIPYGDLEDVAVATPSVMQSEDFVALNKILERYKTDYALLVNVVKTGNVYKVSTTPYPENNSAGAEVLFAVSSPSQNYPGVMAQIMKKVTAEMEKKWRATLVQRSAAQSDMIVVLPINGLSEWTVLQKQLKSLPFVDKTDMQALYKNKVYVKIYFSDTMDNMLAKMDRAGFNLTSQFDGTWLWNKPGTATVNLMEETNENQ